MSAAGEAQRESRAAWLRALARTAHLREDGVTLPELVDRQAREFGDAPALIDEKEQLSYADLARRMRDYAAWARAHDLGPGCTLALFAPNSADYLALWLGISRAGATVALVNTGLRGASLAHAFRVAQPKLVIAGITLADDAARGLAELDGLVPLWRQGGGDDACRVDVAARGGGRDSLPSYPALSSRALLLYTSGTTGLPKAANVSHARLMQWSQWFAGLLDVRAGDRMYDCLPLFHSVGGIVAPGAMLAGGGSTVLRAKFSATRFWDDVRDTGSTLFVHVGELCRFLANAPAGPRETEHAIRLCCGNGLSAAIWEKFRQRFAIPRIVEFYASTEGNFSLCNTEGEPGALGRIPGFLRHRVSVVLVRIDPETGMPLRDAAGHCVACDTGETGEAICRIAPGADFEGYTDAAASERKILRDAFATGDAWLRSGDLMRQDSRGYYYFVDRLGDSFRYNSENVSTQEVAATIASCPGVAQTVVYGVRVAGVEGRAGMAALVAGEGFDPARLHRYLRENLPAPARPRFLRLCRAIPHTATFKPQIQRLQEEGYERATGGDAILVDSHDTYVALESSVLRAEPVT